MPQDQVSEPFLEEVRGLEGVALGGGQELTVLELCLEAAHGRRQAAVAIGAEHVPSLGRAAASQRFVSGVALVRGEVTAVPFPGAIQAGSRLVGPAAARGVGRGVMAGLDRWIWFGPPLRGAAGVVRRGLPGRAWTAPG